MAEKTEKKRKYKDLSDAEKYQFWKEGLKKTGKITLGGAILVGVGAVVYRLGESRGEYECLEYIHNNFHDCAEIIESIDPAFFTTLQH